MSDTDRSFGLLINLTMETIDLNGPCNFVNEFKMLYFAAFSCNTCINTCAFLSLYFEIVIFKIILFYVSAVGFPPVFVSYNQLNLKDDQNLIVITHCYAIFERGGG